MAALQPLRNRIFFSFGAHRAHGVVVKTAVETAALRQNTSATFGRGFFSLATRSFVGRGVAKTGNCAWKASDKREDYEKRLLTKFAYKETQSFAKEVKKFIMRKTTVDCMEKSCKPSKTPRENKLECNCIVLGKRDWLNNLVNWTSLSASVR